MARAGLAAWWFLPAAVLGRPPGRKLARGPTRGVCTPGQERVSQAIISAAKTSFLKGDRWAYTAGLVAVLFGTYLVFAFFPSRDEEITLLEGYRTSDTLGASAAREP